MNKFLIIISLFVSSALWSQTTTISPFSKINIGDVDGAVFSRNFAMGRLAYGLSGSMNLNPYNPASYSNLVWTNFEVAVISKNYFLTSDNQSQSANKTHFNNLSLGIPVTKWWGASLGLMPASHLGYDYRVLGSIQSDTSSVPYENTFFGSGGLNRIFMGHGINIKKKIYLGFNFSYYFGNMKYEEVIAFTESDNYLNTGALKRVDAGDIYLDFGFQYKMKLTKRWKATLGAVFVPTQGISATQSQFNFTYNGDAGNARVIDTVTYTEEAPFSIILPPKLGVGLVLNRSNRLIVGLDIDYVKWSVSNYNTITGLNDVFTVRSGLEYTGKDNRYKIRMGLRYGKMPIVLNGNEMYDMAASFGIVLPFRSKDKLNMTEMNFGAEVGQRGKNEPGMLLEQYINVHVGLTLNNKWFIKRKFD